MLQIQSLGSQPQNFLVKRLTARGPTTPGSWYCLPAPLGTARSGQRSSQGLLGTPSPQKVGGHPEGQLPTGVVSSAHTARRTAAMERYSVSPTTQEQVRAVCGVKVTRGQKPRESTSNYAEKYHGDAASEWSSALLTGSRTTALHLNKDWVSWGEGERKHLTQKGLRAGTHSSPSPPGHGHDHGHHHGHCKPFIRAWLSLVEAGF